MSIRPFDNRDRFWPDGGQNHKTTLWNSPRESRGVGGGQMSNSSNPLATWSCVCLCAIMIGTSEAADAGSLGKFLSGLIARGVVRGTAHSMDGSAYTPNVPSKSYTPNVLTVDQLVRCLKEASMLDEQSDPLERKRTELQSAGKEVDQAQRSAGY